MGEGEFSTRAKELKSLRPVIPPRLTPDNDVKDSPEPHSRFDGVSESQCPSQESNRMSPLAYPGMGASSIEVSRSRSISPGPKYCLPSTLESVNSSNRSRWNSRAPRFPPEGESSSFVKESDKAYLYRQRERGVPARYTGPCIPTEPLVSAIWEPFALRPPTDTRIIVFCQRLSQAPHPTNKMEHT